ncbi:MAG: methyltransferase domain-containing protein [Candidatus Moraniibacteriota bacterium]
MYEPASPNGETIVFVPGSPGDSVAWFENRDLAWLLEEGFKVFVARHGGVKINDYTKGAVNNEKRGQYSKHIGNEEMQIAEWMKEPELAIEYFSDNKVTVISHSLGGLAVGNSLIELGKNQKLGNVQKWINLSGVTYDMQTFHDKTEIIWREFANGYLKECCQYPDGDKVVDDIITALEKMNESLLEMQLPEALRIISVNPQQDEYAPVAGMKNVHNLMARGLSVVDKTLTEEKFLEVKKNNKYAMFHDFLNLEPETLHRLVKRSISKHRHGTTFENPAPKSSTLKKEVAEPSQREIYDFNSAEYVKTTETDPAKRYLQYPESFRLVGDVDGKDVLDMGCGNGMFTRALARAGARVVAFDTSVEQIKNAIKNEKNEALGIEYLVADTVFDNKGRKFDLVSAIMVLPCAADVTQLKKMFAGASDCLKERGKFVCLTLNPDFKRFGQPVCGRVFHGKENERKINIDFLNEDGSVKFKIADTYFSREDVEKAATAAGFSYISWEKLHVLPEGVAVKGEDFWAGYEEDCPYIGLVAYK